MIFGLPIYFIVMDFYIFAFAGWIYESTFCSIRGRKLVNRGFLVGPYLPLYGFGAVAVYVFLRPFSEVASLLYIMGMVIATILEYITSWLLEVLFHTKWWDYTEEPYNFQGRIALIPSMFWGILSLLMFDVLQPAATYLIELISVKVGEKLLVVLLIITAADIAYTVITTINFRKQLENLYEFRKEMEYYFQDVSLLSLKELLNSTTRETVDHVYSKGFSEGKHFLRQRLSRILGILEESEPKTSGLEERIAAYKEKCSQFLKRNPIVGNQRLVDAFPTMRIITKNHSDIGVKELLLQLKKKAVPHLKNGELEGTDEASAVEKSGKEK